MPKIDLEAIPQTDATDYPAPFHREVQGRWYRRLGPAAGLTAFGASHVVLKPGAWSSQRHWHRDEDELLVMIAGEAVLIEDEGRTIVRPGDVIAWAKGVENGHHLVNESDTDCVMVCISGGDPNGSGAYSDIDMMFEGDDYFHKDGTPYPAERLP
ncbi:putative cupin superfamily protein [Novosphingobium hassiacum]|uniref:Putative cupin superfamily protein n=1 Tax=Novosphingobium hassiacum TaxID=173676 RepID=A0A7W6EVV0_9SPHN|nr:cupin domain-containing protein [Novosphingobium hassiacum]MBB3860074.1 putative cupin superfamily protein [Novosphingobium hassiacum]